MKKCIIAILLSTVFCTACGSGAEEIAASESVAPAFSATSYVVTESGEKIEAGTAVVIDEEIFEDGKLLVVDATKTYFFNDCKFEGKVTVSDKSTLLVFIDSFPPFKITAFEDFIANAEI